MIIQLTFNLYCSTDVPLKIDEETESQLRAEVRQFVFTHSDHIWTGRAVARIFHGIQR